MARKNPAAVLLGRRGGQVKSTAKTIAARANGKKGGRPAKVIKALVIILAVLSLSACGSSPTAPTTPQPPVTPPAPTTVTITGHVTATQGGQPLGGVQAALGATTITTDGSGSFSTSMPPQASVSLALTGASIVPRTIRIAATNTRDVTADAILMGGGFDLNFYRQLVRNATEGGMEPLRRWTSNPTVYIRSVREDGASIPTSMLDTVEQVTREAIPLWSNLGVASVTRGTAPAPAGVLAIVFPGEVGSDRVCGRSGIGPSGTVQLYIPTTSACGCDGTTRIRPRTIRHEIGHAMGFWHTDAATDLMFASIASCDQSLSARELYHARIAYQRPVGNVDPDTDASGPVYLSPLRVQ